MMTYDPAFMNTASCRSAITFIDGDKGILEYRGYPIEQLAEKSTYLEVAYLLLNGELPTADELARVEAHHHPPHDPQRELPTPHRLVPLRRPSDGTLHRLDGRAGHVLSRGQGDLRPGRRGRSRSTASSPRSSPSPRSTTAAPSGMPYAYPDNDLSYTGNFLNMMYRMTEVKYTPNPVLERALDVLFILHADHEQNCSTNAMRAVGSSHVDPYSAVAAAAAALYGPLHGGANEAVLQMLERDRLGRTTSPSSSSA